MKTQDFGKTKKGESTQLYTLENSNGMEVKITNYGGIITECHIPGDDGSKTDVVLGFDSLAPYLEEHPYFGSLVGRVAGRTTNGTFSLDGQDYKLAVNNDSNHLHGGIEGFDKKVWQAEVSSEEGCDILKLEYTSVDGEEGYPGTLKVNVFYILTQNNELRIGYEAITDKATPLCLTNHSYFNLCGAGSALDHEVQIFADSITSNDDVFTLDDKKTSLDNHAADFRSSARLGDKVPHLAYQHGSNYWINHKQKDSYDIVAICKDPKSGREMTVYSDAPCLQFYTGKFLDGTLKSKTGGVYNPHDGICFECHEYPNGANATEFSSNILRPGDVYKQTTVYQFKA